MVFELIKEYVKVWIDAGGDDGKAPPKNLLCLQNEAIPNYSFEEISREAG